MYRPDPPILQIGELWCLTSPRDAFLALSPFLTKSDFENFKNVSLKVLSKSLKYSKELREGISESLNLIAELGDEVNSGKGLDLPCSSRMWIDYLVSELLNKADSNPWSSLSDVLPLIAKASPSIFLDAVEDSLSQKKLLIHQSLLSALESLAWDPNLLSRVTLILAKLARLSESPIDTLKTIFHLWFSQTFANLEQRLNSLDLLIEREPKIAWNLLIHLLMLINSRGFCARLHTPCLKQFSNQDIVEGIQSIPRIVDKVLENVGLDGNRWCEIMENFSALPFQERKKVLSKLSECVNSIKEGRVELWNKLREIILGRFSSGSTGLTGEELTEIEKLFNQLEPEDIIKRYIWLFDEEVAWFLKDYPEVNQKRKDAIQHIKDSLGIDGVIELATQTKNPHLLGTSLAEVSLTDEEEKTLFCLLDTDDRNGQKKIFACQYIYVKSSKEENIYIDKIVNYAKKENWSSRKVVNLFLAFPQKRKVWNLLEEFSIQIQQEYWNRVYPRFSQLPTEDILYALKRLIEKRGKEKSVLWYIQGLLVELERAKDINKSELEELEWLLLPILDGDTIERLKVLQQKLANNPEFFAEAIIKFLEEQNSRAWELLRAWEIIPGSDETGKINYQELKKWVDIARSICKEKNKLEFCDSFIGQVFAHASPDANGNWPPEAICKIIEEVESKELDNGFERGIYNKRGIVAKSLFEGGKEERKLAKKYKKIADKLSIRYPRVSAIFMKLANRYENEAMREDKESEKLDLKW